MVMSVRRVDTGPSVGSVARVAGVLPPLQNLRAAPIGAPNDSKQPDFRKTPFVLRVGFGEVGKNEKVYARLSSYQKNAPKETDLYVWLKVSRPADMDTRRKIVGEISKRLSSRMIEFDENALSAVADTWFDSVYEKSCSGVYETTHAFYTYTEPQVKAIKNMVDGNLDTFVRKLLGSDSSGAAVTIGGNEYTYTRTALRNVSEVEYVFPA